MDISKYLLFIFDTKNNLWREQTEKVAQCAFVPSKNGGYYDISYIGNPKIYHRKKVDVRLIDHPETLNVEDCIFVRRDSHHQIPKEMIKAALEFRYKNLKYWRLFFTEGLVSKVYDSGSLAVLKSCLRDYDAKDVFTYLKEASGTSVIMDADGGMEVRLRDKYERMDFVADDTALASYLNPQKFTAETHRKHDRCIFPFGCNGSQLRAVESAFENQISIIQGPPGTGKTQTILNIIANILIQGKCVLVVSSNNAAIVNIVEKLQKYGYDYLSAQLGSSENMDNFILHQQDKVVPEGIRLSSEVAPSLKDIGETTAALKEVFLTDERLALLKEERAELEMEWGHYKQEFGNVFQEGDSFKRPLSSSRMMKIICHLQRYDGCVADGFAEKVERWWFFTKCRHFYGMRDVLLRKENLPSTIQSIKGRFYEVKLQELDAEEAGLLEKRASLDGDNLMSKLTDDSTRFLNVYLHNRFMNSPARKLFSREDMYRNPSDIVGQYPIVLSTTFSARCLKEVVYDYVIMDEASQVSIETGALALSVGRNVVIVGDSRQLPNVQSQDVKASLEAIFTQFPINEAYDSSTYSFLDSVKRILSGGCGTTLLREHYRCHPRIINFCNQEFYGGELIIMSKGDSDDNPIHLIRTVAGNHARGHENVREAEVVCQEILPLLEPENTGVIAAYNKQVDLINRMKLSDVKVSTVHKFQGQERDNIIIDFVDNQPTDFSDDPNLMNVAVSRAKDHLYLVVTGNELEKGSRIGDLVDYISYNKGEVSQSKIRSIFDILYSEMEEDIIREMGRSGVGSPAEVLTLNLVKNLIEKYNLQTLGVRLNYSLRDIIRDLSLLTDEERAYAQNPLTHVDLLIFNKVSKKPVLAIETDGYAFHYGERASVQHHRDLMKDSIMQKYALPLIRLSTTGSQEEEKIRKALGVAV